LDAVYTANIHSTQELHQQIRQEKRDRKLEKKDHEDLVRNKLTINYILTKSSE
jgi:hypothetical protein